MRSLPKRILAQRGYAPLTIALGPGFTAGQDVDVVVETKRGHRLGRIIREGSAIPDTGIPGIIGGYGKERVIHAARPVYLWISAKLEISWKRVRPLRRSARQMVP